MKKNVLIAIALFCSLLSKAQTTEKITGSITNNDGKAIAAATVLLKKATDSAIVKTAVTNSTGAYTIEGIKAGDYFITISNIGFATASLPKFTLSAGETKALGTATLTPAQKTLQGVVVESKKQMVEVKADKMVVNVEGTINAVGNDGLELLRKSPGVMVDKDDNISMAGKNGVQIYIDGKPSPLSGADLAASLKSLQSSQIESIELITNPSAKYEAAGNAGIINIKLKKNKSLGTNGSVNAGYGVGVHGKYNAGINLNNRNKYTNIFGSYNFSHSLNLVQFNLDRTIGDSSFNQATNIKPYNTNNAFKLGLDYFIDKKSTIGFLVNGNINNNDVTNFSRTLISHTPNNTLTKQLVADNSTDGQRNNANLNANYKYTDPKGRDFSIDADYGFYNIRSNQNQPNYYYNAAGNTIVSQAVYNFIAPTDINIFALKTDYEQNFKKGKLGFGGKTSFVKTNNHFERYNVLTTGRLFDIARSNDFDYTENINALYVNYNRPLKGKQIQIGLRTENTVSEGSTYGLNADATINTASKISFKRIYIQQKSYEAMECSLQSSY